MNIIRRQPNPSGAYGQVYHSFSGLDPSAYCEITAGMTNFYTWNGFIIPTIENGVVTSFVCNTEAWEAWKATQPQPLTELEKARQDALNRIDGKCSATIASGVDYNGKHYGLTETKQGYLNTAYLEILGGKTQVKLAADGEDVTWHTAVQITELFEKATSWGKVCIYYKGYLIEWVKAEADSVVLGSIDYGNALPSAYMQTLSAKLAEEGINLADYVEMLNYKDNI